MRPQVSLFDQAAGKLREAMEGPASGAERMWLIQEALALYHQHQLELDLALADDDISAPFEPDHDGLSGAES
jgi:hypothetical protein